MTVFEVKVDWASDDDEYCKTELYSTEEKARKAFNIERLQAIRDYGVFDEQTGELIDDDWELETRDNYWELFEKDYWSENHCLITLTKKEVL